MQEWDVVGVIAALVALFVAVIAPIIRLNTSITKLNTTMEIFAKKCDKTDEALCKHSDQLADHETRITVIESKPPHKRTA